MQDQATVRCDVKNCGHEETFDRARGPGKGWRFADVILRDGSTANFTACSIHRATVEEAVRQALAKGLGTVTIYHSEKDGDHTTYNKTNWSAFTLLTPLECKESRAFGREQEETRKARWLLNVRLTGMGALKNKDNTVTCALTGEGVPLRDAYGVIVRKADDPEGDPLGVIFFQNKLMVLSEGKGLVQRLLRLGEIAVCDFSEEQTDEKVVKTIYTLTTENVHKFSLAPGYRLMRGRELRARYEDQVRAAEDKTATHGLLAAKGIVLPEENGDTPLTTNLGEAMAAAAKPGKKHGKGKKGEPKDNKKIGDETSAGNTDPQIVIAEDAPRADASDSAHAE